MLSKEEEKIIKKYALRLKLAIPCLVVAFLIGGVWLILVMIDDIGFEATGPFYELGFGVYIGIVILYLFLFCFFMLSVKFGTLGKKLVEQGGSVTDVADRYGVKLPSAKKYVVLSIVLPIVLLVGAYIPRFMQSIELRNEQIRVVSETEDKIKKVFEETFSSVRCDDPKDHIRSSYSVAGHMQDDMNCYINVTIDDEGKLKAINYHTEVSVLDTPEESLKRFNEVVQQMNAAFMKAEINSGADIAEINSVPEELSKEYVESDGKKDVYERMEQGNVKISFSYKVENQSSSTSPYLYFTVEY